MPEHTSSNAPREQAAVAAWLEFAPRAALRCERPRRIAVLKDRGHSAVYRLSGAGPRRAAVIAKCCTPEDARIESAVYQDILPGLRLPALEFYGWFSDSGGRCWLFLDDAGDQKYSCFSGRHRTLAGRWLGAVHSCAAHLAAPPSLPERGQAWYLGELRLLREHIHGSLSNPALHEDELQTLKAVLEQCRLLESCWNGLTRLCERIPRTLVHGDLSPKNTRIRSSRDGDELVAIDWETAGWGVPAIDLASGRGFSLIPDLRDYLSALQPGFADAEAVALMAEIGQIFRLIVAMNWETGRLAGRWPARAVRRMRFYQAALADTLRASRWRRDDG